VIGPFIVVGTLVFGTAGRAQIAKEAAVQAKPTGGSLNATKLNTLCEENLTAASILIPLTIHNPNECIAGPKCRCARDATPRHLCLSSAVRAGLQIGRRAEHIMRNVLKHRGAVGLQIGRRAERNSFHATKLTVQSAFKLAVVLNR
jgi:hypothetical protein